MSKKIKKMKNKFSVAKLFLAFLVFGCFFAPTSARALDISENGLDISENGFYWQYRGNPILLIGGGERQGPFQLKGSELTDELDLLVSVGGNYIRNVMTANSWSLEGGIAETGVHPFKKLPSGKYDLDQWNDEYWNRLNNFLTQTQSRDIIVSIEVWEHEDIDCWYGDDGGWGSQPWHPNMNINYTAAETGLPVDWPYTPWEQTNPLWEVVPALNNVPKVRQYQDKYIKKLVEVCGNYDNVMFVINNESPWPFEIGDYWAAFIHNEASKIGKTFMVADMRSSYYLNGDTHRHPVDHPELYNFIEVSQNNRIGMGQEHYDQIMYMRNLLSSQNRPMNNVKIYCHDKSGPNLPEHGEHRFWRNIFGGCASARFHRQTMGDSCGSGLNSIAQRNIKSMAMLVDEIDIFSMIPNNNILSSRDDDEAYCLSKTGEQYVVYFPDGGSVSIDLSSGTFKIKWLDIANSIWGSENIISGGTQSISAPGLGQWVCLVMTESSSDTTPPEITVFTVNPTTADTNETITINYTVTDETALKQVELWRKKDGGSWAKINTKYISGTTASGSFTDSIACTTTTEASFSDDFSIDTTGDYTVTDTWTIGGVGQFLYDASGQRAQVLTGNNIGLQFSHGLSPSDSGTFSIDFLPYAKYPSGGYFYLRLVQDANTYYELFNTDGYGPKFFSKIVSGSQVDIVNFSNQYSQNNNYPITINFSPEQTTVDAFGESLVINTNTSSIMINSFEFDTGQQDAYFDNIVYAAAGTHSSGTHYYGVHAVDTGNNVGTESSSIRVVVNGCSVPLLIMSQDDWSLVDVDSEETVGEDGEAENSFDGDPYTIWHTEWSLTTPGHPHEIQIDLGDSYELGGFRYLPRQGGSGNGMIDEYEFYVSTSGTDWGELVPVANGNLAADRTEKTVLFDITQGRYIRLVALSEVNGGPWTSMAELNVLAVQPDSDK